MAVYHKPLKMNRCDHFNMSKKHIFSLFRAAFTQKMKVSPLILFFHCNELFMRFNKILFEFSLFLHFLVKTPPKMLLKTGFWQSAKPLSLKANVEKNLISQEPSVLSKSLHNMM